MRSRRIRNIRGIRVRRKNIILSSPFLSPIVLLIIIPLSFPSFPLLLKVEAGYANTYCNLTNADASGWIKTAGELVVAWFPS